MYLQLLVNSIRKGDLRIEDVSNEMLRLKLENMRRFIFARKTTEPKEIMLKEIAEKLNISVQKANTLVKKFPECKLGFSDTHHGKQMLYKREVLEKIRSL